MIGTPCIIQYRAKQGPCPRTIGVDTETNSCGPPFLADSQFLTDDIIHKETNSVLLEESFRYREVSNSVIWGNTLFRGKYGEYDLLKGVFACLES